MDDQQPIATKRKPARQKRALVTLEAIRVAAIQVLEREGLEKFSTTKVAERAGVSVGTLYQYYRNADELLQVVVQTELGSSLKSIEHQFAQVPKRERARAVVRALLAGFSQAAESRPVLLDLLLSGKHQAGVARQVQNFLSHLSSQIEDQAQLSREATFVLTRAVLGVVRSILLERSDLAAARLENHLVLLIQSYFVAAQDAGSDGLAADSQFHQIREPAKRP